MDKVGKLLLDFPSSSESDENVVDSFKKTVPEKDSNDNNNQSYGG